MTGSINAGYNSSVLKAASVNQNNVLKKDLKEANM